MSNSMRVILPLLKAPITDITPTGFKILLGAQYGSPTTIEVHVPTHHYDLRDGDIQTLYTEVLLNAKPSKPSVQ